jgi:hypothetical protein
MYAIFMKEINSTTGEEIPKKLFANTKLDNYFTMLFMPIIQRGLNRKI